MAKKIQSKEELEANIRKAKNEIRQGENRVKQLQKEVSRAERNQRTHRLIARGAIAESLIDGADALTNEQFKTLLSAGLRTGAAREVLAFFVKSSGASPTAAATMGTE